MAAPTRPATAGAQPVLDRVRCPADLAGLAPAELDALAEEIRGLLITAVARTGGHLGSNLGSVELTIALHRMFRSPRDPIVFDTGHQAYVHKLLTGRREGFATLRQPGGLSGYPCRAESEHDLVENSHASTALSYADGLAKGLAVLGERDRTVVAVVGDGALTGGMAWEALNNLGAGADRRVVVVVNDNGRSYSPTIGGLAAHLASLRSSAERRTSRALFQQLGLSYLGPVDGHDREAVERALGHARSCGGPVVVHCVTRKGCGFGPAEADAEDHLHSPGPFDPCTGEAVPKPGTPWTSVFAEEIAAIADERPDLVAITAAMLHPTGLAGLARRHPERVFDVGIAEQHALTSAAGLAMAGLHPVVALYSTFLNRAFDQLLMDVALHRLPVTLVLDRAGVTGDDGPSHNGMWDLSLMRIVPGLRVAAPRDAATLRELLREAVAVRDCPTAIRFPKGPIPAELPAVRRIGQLDVLARSSRPDVLLVGVGAMAHTCMEVATRLGELGAGATVVDPRWVQPIDPALVALAARHRLVAVVEDCGTVGGTGEALGAALRTAGADGALRVYGLPQRFLEHGRRAQLLADAGLTADQLTETLAAELAAPRCPGATAPPPKETIG